MVKNSTTQSSSIQVQNLQQSIVIPVTAIQGPIMAFDVLELQGMTIVYAVRNVQKDSFQLIQRQIVFESLLDYQMSLSIGSNCGTTVKTTATFTLIACPTYQNNTGMVTLVQNSIATSNNSLQLIQNIYGDSAGSYFGSQLDTLTFNNGLQVYVFMTSTMAGGKSTQVVQLEILYDKSTQSLAIETTIMNQPLPDSANSGNLSLGAGDRYLIMMYSQFDRFQGFTYCSQFESVDPLDSTNCIPCSDGHVSLSPSDQHCTSCSTQIQGS